VTFFRARRLTLGDVIAFQPPHAPSGKVRKDELRRRARKIAEAEI
jgi:hypothetical protein